MRTINCLKDAGRRPPIERRGVFVAPPTKRSAAKVRPAGRPMRVVLATQQGVERYEPRRGVYREYLVMGGIKWRSDRRQLPLVDNGDRSTVSNIHGSVRDIRVERGGKLVGNVYFASDKQSQKIAAKVSEGHIAGFEVQASPITVQQLGTGERRKTAAGTMEGPADIVVAWRPICVALHCGAGSE